MKTRPGWFLATFLLCGASLAGGYLFGHRSPSSLAPGRGATVSAPAAVAGRIEARTSVSPDSAPAASLEQQLKAALNSPYQKRWNKFRDVARTVDPAHALEALALAERILPR